MNKDNPNTLASEPCPSCGSFEKVTEGNPEILECGQCYHAWQPAAPATAPSEARCTHVFYQDNRCVSCGTYVQAQPAAPEQANTEAGPDPEFDYGEPEQLNLDDPETRPKKRSI